MRTWTITIAAPCEWLTANFRGHHMARARLTAQWRRAACVAANIAMLPTDLERVRIDAVAHFRGRAPVREASNLHPTLKAAVDGLGPQRRTKSGVAPGHGLIADDDDKHLDGPHITIGDKLPPHPYAPVGELVLVISEIEVMS